MEEEKAGRRRKAKRVKIRGRKGGRKNCGGEGRGRAECIEGRMVEEGMNGRKRMNHNIDINKEKLATNEATSKD